jgi:hypothetical protein
VNRLVEWVIRLLLRVTGTYLTHDSGFELPSNEWGVDNPKSAEKARREWDAKYKKDFPEAPPKTCPKCTNTLDHRPPLVTCFTPTCDYTREKP